eukprot:14208499-Alexandrium_andersonii.AAC.1
MSASLVGSEMCIRDRLAAPPEPGLPLFVAGDIDMQLVEPRGAEEAGMAGALTGAMDRWGCRPLPVGVTRQGQG